MKLRFRDTLGSAMVEMALTTPLFMLLIFGSFELGRIAYFAIEVQSASRAGAAYGSLNLGNDYSSSATIEQAAMDDAPDLTRLTTLTVSTPVTYCVCETTTVSGTSSSSSYSAWLDCGSSTIQNCKGGDGTTEYYNIRYVKVDTQATVDPLIHLPGLPSTFTLYGSTRMRVLNN